MKQHFFPYLHIKKHGLRHTACIIKANFHHVNSELTHFNVTSELINIELTQLNHRHYIEGPHKVHINIDVFKRL